MKLNIEKEFNYLWMMTVGFILYVITVSIFSMNYVNIKETNKLVFYGLQMMFWYPVIQLMITKIKRLKGLMKK